MWEEFHNYAPEVLAGVLKARISKDWRTNWGKCWNGSDAYDSID
jgi:hypothetical protein